MPPRMKGQPETGKFCKSRPSIKLSELLDADQWVELSLMSEEGRTVCNKVRILPLPCSYKRFKFVYDILLVNEERTSGDFRDTVIPDVINEGERLIYWALNDLWEVYVDKIYVLPYGKGHSD